MEKKVIFAFGALALLAVVGLAIALFAQSDNIEPETVETIVSEAIAEEQQATEQAIAAKQLELERKLAELAEAKDAEREAALEELREELVNESTTEANAGAEELYPSGELIDDVFLGDIVSFSLDDGDLNHLVDQEIRFNEDDYDVHEEFVSFNNGLTVLYSAVDDEEFSSEPYIGVEKGTLEYRLVFDDPINMSEVSDDESLIIPFLGTDMEVVGVTANEVKFRSGTEFTLRDGESIEFDGKEVVLEFISENNRVTVSVDGVAEVVNEFDTERINGLDVRAEDILVNSREGIATLLLGEDTLLELDNGEEWLGQDDNPFEFSIVSSGGFLEAFVLSYEERHDELNDEFPVLGLGDSIAFPNEHVTLEFAEILENDYIEFKFEFDGFNDELENGTDVINDECILVSTSDRDIEVLDEEADEVYVCKDNSSFYEDNSGDWYQALVTDVRLVNDDAEYNLSIGGVDRLRIESLSDTLIRLDTVWADEKLGVEENDAEAGDILFGNNGVGKVEYDILTPFGAILVDVENNADSDEFVLNIPSDRIELELLVR